MSDLIYRVLLPGRDASGADHAPANVEDRTTLGPHPDAQRGWASFALFFEDGRVCLSNNAAERAIRGIAVGRRNWTFAGSDAGGETLADAMTVIETAKLSGLDPEAYLRDILARINDHKINRLNELLPWNWTPTGFLQDQAA
jgi:hypothetical protein